MAEVALLHQKRPGTAHGEISQEPGAGDAATHHEDVVALAHPAMPAVSASARTRIDAEVAPGS